MLGSSIAEQGNVSDAVSQVVEVRTHPTYTAVDGFGEGSGRFVSWHSAEAVTRRIWL